MGLTMNIAYGCRQHPYKREQCADRKCPKLHVLGTKLQPQEKEPGQRLEIQNEESWHLGWAAYAKQRDIQKQPCHLPEETGVQLLCAASYGIYGAETWARIHESVITRYDRTYGNNKLFMSKKALSYLTKTVITI